MAWSRIASRCSNSAIGSSYHSFQWRSIQALSASRSAHSQPIVGPLREAFLPIGPGILPQCGHGAGVSIWAASRQDVPGVARHGLIAFHVPQIARRARGGSDQRLRDIGLSVGSTCDRQQSCADQVLRGLIAGRVVTELFPIHGRLRHPQPTLPPDDPSQFLDEVFFGRPIRGVLFYQSAEQALVLALVLPSGATTIQS